MKTPSASSLIKLWTQKKQTWMTVESASGGALAAEFTGVAGASKAFAGALVVYDMNMKQFWLDINPEDYGPIEDGAVGLEITEALAESALNLHPQVDGVIAVTGHYGPNAPKHLDGKVFFAVAVREMHKKGMSVSTQVLEVKLTGKTREKRREESLKLAIRFVSDSLGG